MAMEDRRNNRDKQIHVRVSAEELALVEKVCEGAGIRPATYVRMVLMRDLQSSFPSDPLAQLKAREVQDELGAKIAAMMLKAFKEAEKEKKRK
jgi:hypothetical protein